MSFEDRLRIYANLLVTHGINVQPGQKVSIGAEAIHRDLALLCVEECYKKGASFVDLDLTDPRTQRLRIENSTAEQLEYVPEYLSVKYQEIVDSSCANLRISGSEYPDILQGLDARKINTARLAQYQAVKYFYDEGIGRCRVQWCLAAAATPEWGLKVFPDAESPEKAMELLWDQIFKICRVYDDDCLQSWREHNAVLHERAKRLTALNIKELHFEGPGTDLIVGLSPKAIFRGGTETSSAGIAYEPNIPTEECFTTPDCRVTRGTARATRPFLINGNMIRGLSMTFENGSIVDFKAEEGQETFEEYISSDDGAKKLGEVALVGIDSPVFQSGLVFETILFDENAACHIAVGSAYKSCLEHGERLTEEELAEIGCNVSSVHTDMMISSEEVSVTAQTYDGQSVTLIDAGKWSDF